MDSIKLTRARATLVRLGHRLDGTLHLMKHHMVFKAEQREVWISFPIIVEAVRAGSVIRIVCKDFMFLSLELATERECRLVFETIEDLRVVRRIDQLYAFVYSPATLERDYNGWLLYADPEKEYRRMGALDTGKWRLSAANRQHQLCPTYPRHLVVPTNISDNVLAYAAKFRSKGRLPVLSYHLALNNCTITRCSQPLVGLKQSRSMQDEALVSAIWSTTQDPLGKRGAQPDHLVMDLRPSTNAIAQVALGGGTENIDRYKPARKAYLGIDNLHVMRDSLVRVVDALRHSDVGDEPPNPAALERSAWLRHVALIVESSRTVVQQVYFKCSHVLVHCSDGWDRTPQITSLAMLCLDPYYRTFEGFMVLVEKEWVSFGHQFALRANIVNTKGAGAGATDAGDGEEPAPIDLLANVTNFISETTKGRQDGPIFQQFLDCAYQVLCLFPTSFEFNERFLRRLVYHAYACQYGTFLFNSERDMLAQEAAQRTRSVWDYFLARRAQFVNPRYEKARAPEQDVLVIPASWRPRWWAGVFGRVDADMNDPDAWRQTPMKRTAAPPHQPSQPQQQPPQPQLPPEQAGAEAATALAAAVATATISDASPPGSMSASATSNLSNDSEASAPAAASERQFPTPSRGSQVQGVVVS